MVKPFLSALLLLTTLLSAEENPFGRALLLNHPSSVTLNQKEVELSLEYGIVNSTIDVFNIKSQEVSQERAESSFGDYDHLRAHLNIGLTDNDMILVDLITRDINYGSSSIISRHYELGYRHSFAPWVALDVTFKANDADDIRLTDANDLNSTVHKIDSRLSIDHISALYIWFYKTGDNSITYGVPYVDTPYASLTEMYDLTGSARLTFGQAYKDIYPNFFLEAGYTYASALANTNMFDDPYNNLPSSIEEKIPSLPIDLTHSEVYTTVGINSFIHLPWNFGAYAEYNFQYFFRDKEFTEGNTNQTIILELNYAVIQRLTAAVSGIYFHQQLNGVIPFLYNEQSQNSFDHKYGWAAFSLSYAW